MMIVLSLLMVVLVLLQVGTLLALLDTRRWIVTVGKELGLRELEPSQLDGRGKP